jgi:repressor LexA
VREIAAEFGIRSPNGVVAHLRALEKKGFIKRRPGITRGIEVVA